MGLLDGLLGNASKIEPAQIQQEFAKVLAPGEKVEHAYKLIRDLPPARRPALMILLTDGLTPWPEERDRIAGVRFITGILCNTPEEYRQRITALPSWIVPVHIPLGELSRAA